MGYSTIRPIYVYMYMYIVTYYAYFCNHGEGLGMQADQVTSTLQIRLPLTTGCHVTAVAFTQPQTLGRPSLRAELHMRKIR